MRAASDGIALVGGSWRPMRGTLAWQEGRPTDEELRELFIALSKPRRPTPPPPDLIACPCGARLTETCKTSGGHPTLHVDRIVSRRCLCGEVLAARKQWCEPCRWRARKQTYRLREIRKATAQRRRGSVAA